MKFIIKAETDAIEFARILYKNGYKIELDKQKPGKVNVCVVEVLDKKGLV